MMQRLQGSVVECRCTHPCDIIHFRDAKHTPVHTQIFTNVKISPSDCATTSLGECVPLDEWPRLNATVLNLCADNSTQ